MSPEEVIAMSGRFHSEDQCRIQASSAEAAEVAWTVLRRDESRTPVFG